MDVTIEQVRKAYEPELLATEGVVGRFWTEVELKILREKYFSLSNRALRSHLPNRSELAIKLKALRLGLKKNPLVQSAAQANSLRGRPQTEQHKNNLSKTRKRLFKEGKLRSWTKGLTKETSPSLKKFSDKMKGRKVTWKSCSESLKTYYATHPNPFKGRNHTEESKNKMRLAQLAKNRVYSDEYRENARNRTRRLWQDSAYRRKVVRESGRALRDKPSSLESKVIDLCKLHGLPLRYIGDGSLLVGQFNPDFITTNDTKKIVEVFGRVFHDPEKTFKKSIPWHQQYWGRMAYYSQIGYGCLILWDDELDDETAVVHKMRDFLNDNS